MVAFRSNMGLDHIEVSMHVQAPQTEELIRRMTPASAPPGERAQVEALSRLLDAAAHESNRSTPKCELVGPRGEKIELPEAVFHVLARVVEVLAEGDAI